MGHKCHDKNKSLQCNIDKLADRLFQPVSEPVKVTRDAFNVPTITGGTFQEMWRTFGYESARDKLWNLFFYTKIFSGQLASLFGSFAIASDVDFRSQLPSTAEILKQFDDFSVVVKTQFTSILEGHNQRIDDVNNGVPGAPLPAEFAALGISPIPHLELAEVLASNITLGRLFTAGEIEFFNQLDFFSSLETLVAAGKTVNEGLEILSDTYNSTLRRGYGIIAESSPTLPIPCNEFQTNSKTSVRNMSKVAKSNTTNDQSHVVSISSFNDMIENVSAYRKEKCHIESGSDRPKASFGLTIRGKHTSSGKPAGLSGIQAFLSDLPGVYWQYNLINKKLGLTFSGNYFAGFFPLLGNTFSNEGYTLCHSVQVTSLPGIPALLEDPNEDIVGHEETIKVAGASDVVFNVYCSPYKGYVSQVYVAPNVVRAALTSPLFLGEKSIVKRNLSFGKQLAAFDVFSLLSYAKSLDEYENTVRGPGWSTGFGLFFIGHDNRCNIFGTEAVGWYDFKSAGASDLIPEGILGNPIPDESQVPLRTGYLIRNPKQGFIVNWNTPLTQTLPSMYGDAEYSRVEWMEDAVTDLISKGKITPDDLQDILIRIGNGVNGAAPLSSFTGQNYNTPAFVPLFKKRFFDAVGTYPNPDRLAAVELLSDFDGSWIEGDHFAIVNSHDVSDKWILAQQWFFYVQQRIMEPTFGAAWSSWFSSNKNATRGGTYGRRIQGLISRLLGTSPVNNPIHYPNWLTPIPDLDQLIVDALDDALAFLGPRPWGVDQRPDKIYSNSIFGPLPFDGQATPAAGRAANYTITTAGKCGSVNIQTVCQIGNSSLTLFEDQVPVPQDTLQSRPWLNYDPLQRLTIANRHKHKCKCNKHH
jgi:hypothetical protein